MQRVNINSLKNVAVFKLRHNKTSTKVVMEFYTKHAALMSLSELFTIRYPSDPICTVKEVKKKHLYTQAKSEARIGMFEASLIKS